jgi:hypothetical protein
LEISNQLKLVTSSDCMMVGDRLLLGTSGKAAVVYEAVEPAA